ncbi:MAG: hypothetical protein IKF54_02365 [Eubacterium sp.]|nr:hypothetical protein [Eubacterium sp.]
MNKNFKKVLVVLLSALMVFTYMPAMAFAEGEELKGASVTTSETTEAIQYETFADALEATNVSANAAKKAVITLNEDADAPNATVAIPLTIKLNGHKLTETESAALAPAVGAKGSTIAEDAICRKNADAEIIFAKHKTNTVYNWEQQTNGKWHVVSKLVSCENCGEVTESVSGTTDDGVTQDGKITYTYSEDGVAKSTKVVDAAPAAAYTTPKANIVVVNGVNQHKDGLPVVKATVYDVAIKDDVDADAKVTAATEAEIRKLTTDSIPVYAENGTTETTGTNAKNNEPATCKAKGKVIYKVVVSAKDGTEVGTLYIKDSQAVAETDHVKGALKGIKWLVKSAAYDSEEDALAAAKTAKKVVIKVTTATVSNATKYYYWSYDSTIAFEGTKTISQEVTKEVPAAALEADGSFTYMPVYYCNFEDTTEIDDAAVTVKPLADAKTATEANDGKHSSCTQWKYAEKAYTYTFGTGAVQSTFTCTFKVSPVTKDAEHLSHISDGTLYDVTLQPTCKTEGKATVKCAICGESNVEVDIPKLADKFGAWTGENAPAIGSFVIGNVTLSGTKHKVTLNADKTEATVTPTCTQPGGTFKFCTQEGGHWVLQGEAVPATGHNLAIVTEGNWGTGDNAPDYNGKKADYTYIAKVVCSNAACDASAAVFDVTYHSAKGTDGISDKFSAIEINKEEKGKDCQTKAKTTYTVKNVKDRTGAAITTSVPGDDSTKGPHTLEATGFNWSNDFESATVTAKCTVKGCNRTDLSETAKVTKATDATGLTTYTATYGEKSEVKKVYTLDGAKVTYDTTKITDGNLVKGIDGAAAQTPEVTVTLNGTVIDSKELKETWSYDTTTSEVGLTVTWADNKAYDDDAAKKPLPTDKAEAKKIKVAAKSKFNAPTVVVKKGGKETAARTGEYDPATTWSVEATSAVKGATVKYAVDEKDLEQEDIELLAFDLDKVDDIQDAGTYYVYAQQTKDGYTTYSKLAATITISKKSVEVAIDNFTMKEGETPDFKMTVTAGGSVLDVDRDQFDVTSAGGQALEDLIPGDYVLLVSSDNYNVRTLFVEGRVGTVTVLTKEGKTAEEDAKAAAEAADTALAAAKKVNTKNYTDDSVKNVAAAKKALQEAIKSGSTADVKAATAALQEAIKNAVAKKANPMKVKAKAKVLKAKAKKATKIAAKKAFKFTKKAQGKVTYKKASGNKKITVAKNGKITVKKGLKKGKTFKIKVKVTAAGNANYKKATKAVTLKIKIK